MDIRTADTSLACDDPPMAALRDRGAGQGADDAAARLYAALL
jgi:hypothetical protein